MDELDILEASLAEGDDVLDRRRFQNIDDFSWVLGELNKFATYDGPGARGMRIMVLGLLKIAHMAKDDARKATDAGR